MYAAVTDRLHEEVVCLPKCKCETKTPPTTIEGRYTCWDKNSAEFPISEYMIGQGESSSSSFISSIG